MTTLTAPAPIAAYLNAVAVALDGTGIPTVRQAVIADETMLTIELVAPGAALLWTPRSGWRAAQFADDGAVVDHIRYLRIGTVPAPAAVAESVAWWLTSPTQLSDEAPFYPRMPRERLAELLAAGGAA